jgi:hypothetical protein
MKTFGMMPAQFSMVPYKPVGKASKSPITGSSKLPRSSQPKPASRKVIFSLLMSKPLFILPGARSPGLLVSAPTRPRAKTTVLIIII